MVSFLRLVSFVTVTACFVGSAAAEVCGFDPAQQFPCEECASYKRVCWEGDRSPCPNGSDSCVIPGMTDGPLAPNRCTVMMPKHLCDALQIGNGEFPGATLPKPDCSPDRLLPEVVRPGGPGLNLARACCEALHEWHHAIEQKSRLCAGFDTPQLRPCLEEDAIAAERQCVTNLANGLTEPSDTLAGLCRGFELMYKTGEFDGCFCKKGFDPAEGVGPRPVPTDESTCRACFCNCVEQDVSADKYPPSCRLLYPPGAFPPNPTEDQRMNLCRLVTGGPHGCLNHMTDRPEQPDPTVVTRRCPDGPPPALPDPPPALVDPAGAEVSGVMTPSRSGEAASCVTGEYEPFPLPPVFDGIDLGIEIN